MGTHKNSRIGVCVICFPAYKEGRAPLGKVGRILTNTQGPSKMQWFDCLACDGKGYTNFRSDK